MVLEGCSHHQDHSMGGGREERKKAPTSISFHLASLAGAFHGLRSREYGNQDNSVFKDETSRTQSKHQNVESGWEVEEAEHKQRISSTQDNILDLLNRFPLSCLSTTTWQVPLSFINGESKD